MATTSTTRQPAGGGVWVAAAASLWGLWSVVFKTAERQQPGLSGAVEALAILVVIGVALLPRAVLDRRRAPRRAPRDWALVGVLGVCDALNTLCFFSAMQHTTVAIAVLTHYLTPLLVALLAPLLLRERWQVRTFVALAVSLAGLVLLLEPWRSSSSSSSSASSALGLGALLGASSALFYAGGVIAGKKVSGVFSGFELGAWPKLVSAPLLLVAVWLGASDAQPLLSLPAASVLVVGGVLIGAVPLLLFYRGLARVPASTASLLTLCEPTVAVVVGTLLWDEPFSALNAAGGALVLGAAAWLSRAE